MTYSPVSQSQHQRQLLGQRQLPLSQAVGSRTYPSMGSHFQQHSTQQQQQQQQQHQQPRFIIILRKLIRLRHCSFVFYFRTLSYRMAPPQVSLYHPSNGPQQLPQQPQYRERHLQLQRQNATRLNGPAGFTGKVHIACRFVRFIFLFIVVDNAGRNRLSFQGQNDSDDDDNQHRHFFGLNNNRER